jgi:hypothetical protein
MKKREDKKLLELVMGVDQERLDVMLSKILLLRFVFIVKLITLLVLG